MPPRDDSDTPPKLLAGSPSRNALAPDDLWFDLDEAAAYLRLARRTVRNYVYRRQLIPDGRSLGPMFRRSTLDAFLEGRVKP